MAEQGDTTNAVDHVKGMLSDEARVLLVQDFLTLIYGDVGDLYNRAAPGCVPVGLNSKLQMEARGELCAIFGSDVMTQFERETLKMVRAYGQFSFQGGKDTARLEIRPGSASGIQAAITDGMRAIVSELRRPKVAVVDDQGNVVGSVPGPLTGKFSRVTSK